MGERHLHEKRVACERIEVHLYASSVADDLEEQAAEHGNSVAPCLVSDREEELGNQRHTEDGSVENISAEGRDVVEVGQAEWASLKCAQIGVIDQGHVETGWKTGWYVSHRESIVWCGLRCQCQMQE